MGKDLLHPIELWLGCVVFLDSMCDQSHPLLGGLDDKVVFESFRLLSVSLHIYDVYKIQQNSLDGVLSSGVSFLVCHWCPICVNTYLFMALQKMSVHNNDLVSTVNSKMPGC